MCVHVVIYTCIFVWFARSCFQQSPPSPGQPKSETFAEKAFFLRADFCKHTPPGAQSLLKTPEMESSRHFDYGALLIVSNGCLQPQIRAKTCTHYVHTHNHTQSYIHTDTSTHRQRHGKKWLQIGVLGKIYPVAEMWLFLFRAGWDFLEKLGFGGVSKVFQSFPKFPKVSQTFPHRLFVRVCGSRPHRLELVWKSLGTSGLPKVTQNSAQAVSLLKLSTENTCFEECICWGKCVPGDPSFAKSAGNGLPAAHWFWGTA